MSDDYGTGQAALLRLAVHERLIAHSREPDGLPTSNRFIDYELIQGRPEVLYGHGNREQGRSQDQNLSDAPKWLRDEGYVRWDWVVDDRRSVTAYWYASIIAEYVRGSVDDAIIHRWAGEPPPLIISESATFGGVPARTVAREYLCPVTATSGQVGVFLHTNVAPLFDEEDEDGNVRRKVRYVGDYNLAGATAAQLGVNSPYSVAVSADGGFLIGDEVNRRVRRVSPTGIITTVAGTGVQGSSGDGGVATAAQFNVPTGVATTPDGGFLIADEFGNRVRWVSPTGVITTVAGTGAPAVFTNGDGGPATAGNLTMPVGVAATPSGGFVFSEAGNDAIRFVDDGFQTAVPPSATTVPGAPTIGSPTFGNASATVTWTAPPNNDGSAITGYLVRSMRAAAIVADSRAGIERARRWPTRTARSSPPSRVGPSGGSGTAPAEPRGSRCRSSRDNAARSRRCATAVLREVILPSHPR
jgi:hypothetical protein